MTAQMISKEDREAFHNKADRITREFESEVKEMNRFDKDRRVRIIYMNHKKEKLAILEVAPRHRFYVRELGEKISESTTRRDEAFEMLEDRLAT